jgi:tetratricopeptide (TPR) repeat protein
LAGLTWGTVPGAWAQAVQAFRGEISLPTYPWTAVKHPYFRGTDKVNIYPYPMLDFLSREKTNRTYQTVVLENDYLRITFLPELGGRIHEVIVKPVGQPMFYVNHVIKPGLIGQCGAWISGGVEWNTGPQGHTVSCMQPVPVEILPPEKDGSRSVAIGETERIYGTKWTVVVTLRPGRSFIEERIRIYNPTETIRPYYFWNCTAMPNTPGFRFIYPMTLGTDHSAEKFFQWPLHEGKDLTRSTNYQDAASIFAWHCDQDFFGSYDDLADRGVVSYANHHQLPGKKAWTWGQGGFGRMHQMDLTDSDGPYNEVQTGPLLTQSEVGRLEPCEAVSWQEWWYPVHGLGGFTFANRDVAANATVAEGRLRLRLLGTGSWSPVTVQVTQGATTIARARCALSPHAPADLLFDLNGAEEPFDVALDAGKQGLARFRVPLDLPVRQPPDKKAKPETATECAQTGWQEFLLAKFDEAEKHFRKALDKDPKHLPAHVGLAHLNLDRDPAAAARAARAGLDAAPRSGRAGYALAVAELRQGKDAQSFDHAWLATRDPATAVAGRALVAKLLLRRSSWSHVIQTLTEPGPWRTDPVCRNRLACAFLRVGQANAARELAEQNLRDDPLDAFALHLVALSRAGAKDPRPTVPSMLSPEATLELVADYFALGQLDWARDVALQTPELRGSLGPHSPARGHPLLLYWVAYLNASGGPGLPSVGLQPDQFLELLASWPVDGVFPHRVEELEPLRWAAGQGQKRGQQALLLGHLRFHLGRHKEAREDWQRALELGAAPVVAHRALGLAALTLDNDLTNAVKHLTLARELDPHDAIVARDLARVLFRQADQAKAAARQKALWTQAREALQVAFDQGKGRSDFVALLARAQSRLGEHAAMAKMLDSVRVTVWEGAREVHDLFVEAHLALGEAHLAAGQAAAALAEFNRALEYPENLATGRLENAREAHIHYLRGNALNALGKKDEAVEAWKKAANEPASKDAKIEAARQQAKQALEKAQPPAKL